MRSRKGSKKKVAKPKASARSASRGSPARSRGRRLSRPLPAFPPALLESEVAVPEDVLAGGPGERFVLGSPAPVEPWAGVEPSELPEAYGSGRLLLVARDPYSVFAHCDLTSAQYAEYQSAAHDGRLYLRLGAVGLAVPFLEMALQHGVKSHFLQVPHAGSGYQGELGYYRAPRRWVSLFRSGVVRTPSDSLAEPDPQPVATRPALKLPGQMEESLACEPEVLDSRGGAETEWATQAMSEVPHRPGVQQGGSELQAGRDAEPQVQEFPGKPGADRDMSRLCQVTLPSEMEPSMTAGPCGPLAPKGETSSASERWDLSGLEALSGESPGSGRCSDRSASPPSRAAVKEERVVGAGMDPAKERALAEMVVEEAKRRHHEGSLELVSKEVSWRNQIGLLDISEGGLAANVKSWLSSEVGEVPGSVVPEASDVDKPGGFWFAVNAELVVYGATEPGAKVLVGNRPLRLRPDGTFSCRFALPDGEYQLEFSAVNAAGSEARAVELRLSRTTRASGGVGNAPQDSGLKVPGPDSAA